jgi:hypothetical protein
MEGSKARFGVCGRHPTLYVVDLPSWLPHNVLVKMVDRFETILDQQIFTMMLDKTARRTRKSSEQSASALNTGSHRDPHPPSHRLNTFSQFGAPQ